LRVGADPLEGSVDLPSWPRPNPKENDMSITYTDAVQKLASDPAAGQVSPSAEATLANGRARVSSGPFNWDVDLAPVVGGENQAPSPTAYLLGALASCAVVFISDTLAPEFGVQIDTLHARASCSTDLAGLLGIDGRDPRLARIAVQITLGTSSPQPAVEALQAAWLDRCPIYLSLVEACAVEVTFEAG
jgi:uncharacterized OsmC-like protein